MGETRTASERITEEVTSWPGVEAEFGARGEFGFRVGRREIGHLHGDRVAHFGLASWSVMGRPLSTATDIGWPVPTNVSNGGCAALMAPLP